MINTFTRYGFFAVLNLIFAFTTYLPSFGQATNERFNFQWQARGPENQGGRVKAMAVDLDGTVYACSPRAGLWRSTNQGNIWQQVAGFNIARFVENDPDANNRCLAASSIAIDKKPNGQSIIYVGTGDLVTDYQINNYNSGITPANNTYDPKDFRKIHKWRGGYLGYVGLPGQGVFVSTDGGRTFSNNNATWDRAAYSFPATNYDFENPWTSVQKLAVLTNGRVFAATSKGLFYSDDQFKTVIKPQETYPSEQLQPGDPTLAESVVFDIELGKSENGQQWVYVCTEKYIFISKDNGTTFSKLFVGNRLTGRIELTIGHKDPNIIYRVEVNRNTGGQIGVWRSADAGESWTLIGPEQTVAFSPLSGLGLSTVFLDTYPEDDNRLIFAGATWFEYTPQRAWYNIFSPIERFPNDPRYMPSFVNCIVADPNNPKTLYVGSSSDMMRSYDGGLSYRKISFTFRQGSTVSVATNLANEIYAGTRTNRIFTQPAGDRTRFMNDRNSPTAQSMFATSILKNEWILVSGTGGQLLRSLNNGEDFETFWGAPDNDGRYTTDSITVRVRANALQDVDNPYPITPFVLDEYLETDVAVDERNRVVNKQYVFYATAFGVWRIRNPFAVVGQDKDDEGKNIVPTWTRVTSALGQSAPGDNLISAMAISGDSTHTLYVGTTAGKIWRIKYAHNPRHRLFAEEDITPTFADGVTGNRWITSITVNHGDPEMIAVTYGGYGIYEAGASRIIISNNAFSATKPDFYKQHNIASLPYTPIYCAQFHPTNPTNQGQSPANRAWFAVGTDLGVYYTWMDNLNFTNSEPEMDWYDGNDGEMRRIPVYDFYVKMYDQYVEVVNPNSNPPLVRRRMNSAIDRRLYIATYGMGVMESGIRFTGRVDDDPKNLDQSLQLALYPNPTQGDATLRLTLQSAANIGYEIYTLDGKQVMSRSGWYFPAGTHALNLPVQGLTPGLYTISVKSEAGQRALRLVIR